MSAIYLSKRILSTLLVLCILTSFVPVNAGSNTGLITSISRGAVALNEGSLPESVNEYELPLNSLLNQLSTSGISVWSGMAAEDVNSPSGIDYSTRVSYVIDGPVYANYESEKTVMLRFTLNGLSVQAVSFDYKIYSGSASYGEHFDAATQGTITFEAGETEKTLEINIPKIVNNPTEFEIASDPGEFWTKDRVLYVNCKNISYALFDNEKDSITVPVAIENQFDFKKSYQKAKDTYLVDLSVLSGVTDFPDIPGKYLNIGSEIMIAKESAIKGDVRTMIDNGVFSHLNMPIGYFLNDNIATGAVNIVIDRYYNWGSVLAFEESILLDDNSKIDLNLGALEISQIGLGIGAEANGLVRSLDVGLDYSALTEEVYTIFCDQNDNYLQQQMNFVDKTNPTVIDVVVPKDTFYFGENIPITVSYNEPVIIDGISMKINGLVLHPMERAGTVSNNISFLYEVKEDYANIIKITDIVGALDISGKAQEAANEFTLRDATLDTFDAEKSFAYCANTVVNINQGTSIHAKGELIVSIKENIALSNWLADRLQIEGLLPVVKAKVIGKDDIPIDVPLYVNDGPVITQLRGEFDVPANMSDQNKYYVAEIYIADNITDEFKVLYTLSKEYVILPITYIDDETDFEILYTNWPATNKTDANNETPISLGYQVKNNGTWQSPNDFLWSSSDENVATITPTGIIVLTGQAGEVTFTLTALNDGSTGKAFPINSKKLEVLKSDATFLFVPAGIRNIEMPKGNNVKVYYATNITENNDSYGGSGAVTTYTYSLYETDYAASELQKGNLVYQQTLDATTVNNVLSYTIDKQYLVHTSMRGKYNYILEISARDLQADKIVSAVVNICVKELPAKAVLSKPQDYYITDEALNMKVSFNIDHKNAHTEFSLTVTKNEEAAPFFTTDHMEDIDKDLMVTINAVDSNRLLDVYTVSLKAKNEFDETYAYDSYIVYVYNSKALKIMVNGVAAENLTLSMNDKLSKMTSDEIIALNRKISLTGEISINNKEYKWSNIADKITWEVNDHSKLILKYKDGGVYRNIEDNSSILFLTQSNFMLQGISSGDTYVTARHEATGMEAKLDVRVDKLEDKLYIFQVYPAQKSTASYINGENKRKTIESDNKGRVAIYEESGIISDVVFVPDYVGLYDYGVIKNTELVANQKSINDFGLYPQNNVILPLLQYKATFNLYDDELERYYEGDVVVRGGVYRNGIYCPDAKINGVSGSIDQIVSRGDFGGYVLNFNPLEFTTKYNTAPLKREDNIEYKIEVRFPDHSYYTKIIKIDNQRIKQARNFPFGVYLDVSIQSMSSTKIRNNVSIVSQTVIIDGKEQQIPERITFDKKPESAVLTIEMMLAGDYNKNYEIEFVDEYNQWTLFSKTNKEVYEFSSTVLLKNTFDLKKRTYYMKAGEKSDLYMIIRASDRDSITEIKLTDPIKIQYLVGIPKMDTLSKDLKVVSSDIIRTISAPGQGDFSAGDSQIKKSLDFLKGYSLKGDSIRLEIKPTDDPLVYKGIIKFTAGDLSRENPSGVYKTDESSSESFNFMPGLSDMKAIKKGDYIKKSMAQMAKNKNGSKGTYKTYGGGAYIECEIFYDVDSKDWNLLLLKSDVHIGAGGGYYQYFNTWVGPVPVTAEFRTGLSVQIGLKTVAEKVYKDDEEKTEYDVIRTYITELNPHLYIYGFGGFGADYEVASLKVGPYGKISLDQKYLWQNGEGKTKNGQKITLSGSTGIKFQASVLFVNYTKKYEIVKLSKTWKYNDFDEINSVWNSKFNKMLFSSYSSDDAGLGLEPVGETVAFEDRTYLTTFDRQWYEALLRRSSTEGISIIQTNSYPNSNPVLTEDGEIMAYISDMDSKDINDTAVCFTKKDEAGLYPVGIEVDTSKFADTDVVMDGTGDAAAVAWTRVMYNFDEFAGEEVTSEDVQNIMSYTEIMASIYNGSDFVTTRLTNNATPDMSPVVAMNGDKAIVAWRSLFASDLENPLDFDGRDNIMYSMYDGANWSEAKCLYDGSIDKVKALNVKMLTDGTAAITYQINKKGTENSGIICAVLDENGTIINSLRVSNNESINENPRITSVVFPDRVERFVIGWNAAKTMDDGNEESTIRLSAMNKTGVLYPQFEKEIENFNGTNNYNTFKFSKGAIDLEDLSIIWTEPTQEDEIDEVSIYKDVIWGKKLIQEGDGSIIDSPKIKLLELDDNHVVDYFDSYVDKATKEINFALLMSDYSVVESQAKLATAKSSYKNTLVVEETYFSYEDLLPGTDMPVLFGLYNDGVEPISKVSIELGGVDYVFDQDIIKPGEYKNLTVLYTVPETIVNPEFTITGQFSTATDIKGGMLKMAVPDVDIYRIDITKEMERERKFNIQLRNNALSELIEGKHVVRLEVYDTPDFNHTPIMVKTISDAKSLGLMNNGVFTQNITMSEEALQGVLDENGEIPKEGVRIYFNAVVLEDYAVIEDADISNNTDYIKIISLLVKNAKPISFASIMQAETNNTVVQVEALNNSMNGITKGNIIVNLRDQWGNIIETQQTYSFTDKDRGLVAVGGEETFTVSFNFSKTGASSDVIFTNVMDDSLMLSELRFKGVPLVFDKNIYNYDLQVTDLKETFINIAAENPNAIITVLKNGKQISHLTSSSLVFGTNSYEIIVKTGVNEVKYTVTIENNKGENNNPSIPVTEDPTNNEESEITKEKPNSEFKSLFQDISESAWFYEAVKFAYDNGLMIGTSENTFSPNMQTTRAMLVTVLYRLEQEPKVNKSDFKDVPIGEYYSDAVAWGQENGIVKGISEIEFAPNISITREQFVLILYRYAAFKGYDTSQKGDLSIYGDSNTISNYAFPAMEWAKGLGLIVGRGKTEIAPQGKATRAEMAMILQRFFHHMNIK